MNTLQKNPAFRIKRIFARDPTRWEGVSLFNIYLLRLMFFLMVVYLGKDSWVRLVTAKGQWNFTDSMSWCVWAAFALLALLGILHPLKMLPVVMLEIVYKVLWLIVVYPYWKLSQAAGSTAAYMANGFLWVPLPIIAMPWRYFWRNYVLLRKKEDHS